MFRQNIPSNTSDVVYDAFSRIAKLEIDTLEAGSANVKQCLDQLRFLEVLIHLQSEQTDLQWVEKELKVVMAEARLAVASLSSALAAIHGLGHEEVQNQLDLRLRR